MKLTPYNLGAPIPENDGSPEWQQKYRPLDNLKWKRFEDEKPNKDRDIVVRWITEKESSHVWDFDYTGQAINIPIEWAYKSEYETAKAQQQQYEKIDEFGEWSFEADDYGYMEFTKDDLNVSIRPDESVLIWRDGYFSSFFENGLSLNLFKALISES